MKKVLILAVMVIISLSDLFAQAPAFPIDEKSGEIVFTNVVPVDSVKSSELFSRAKEWVALTYVSAKNVTQLEDKDAGTIVIKAMINVSTCVIVKNPIGVVRYTFKIQVKDNRYKYEVTDLWHDITVNVDSRSSIQTPGDLRKEKPGGGLFSMGKTNWNCIKNKSYNSIIDLISSLKIAMNKQSKKESNW